MTDSTVTDPAGRSALILLAAGASTRMGEPKPLLDWGGQPLVAWESREALRAAAVGTVVVVLGRRAEHVRAVLAALGRPEAIRYAFNQRWPQGRATSLAVGARALLRAGAAPAGDRPEFVVIQNVDQPSPHEVIDDLIAALRAAPEHDAAQPRYRGKGGHPVVLRGALLPQLAAATEATLGLRAILERHPPLAVPMDDRPVVRLDMDTPAALAEGRRLFGIAPTDGGGSDPGQHG